MNRIKFAIHKVCLISIVLCSTIGCDQVSKRLVRDSIPRTGALSYLNDTIRIDYALNPGAFMNLGAGLPESVRFWFFNVAVALFLVVLAGVLFGKRSLQPRAILAFSLILGGGIGNLIDRVLFGQVTDFLVFGVGRLRTGIFNVADFAIVVGICLLALKTRPVVRVKV